MTEIDTEIKIECPVQDQINDYCSCPKTECPRHGICCQCILAHKNRVDQPILKRLPHCLRDMVKPYLSD